MYLSLFQVPASTDIRIQSRSIHIVHKRQQDLFERKKNIFTEEYIQPYLERSHHGWTRELLMSREQSRRPKKVTQARLRNQE